MLHVSSLLLGCRFQTIWHVSGHGPSPGEPEVGCELQAPCCPAVLREAGEAERCRCHRRGHLRPEDVCSLGPLLSHQPASTWARLPGQQASILSRHSSLYVPQRVAAASPPPGPPRHTWPQTQLRSSREPRHGAAAGEPCPQPRAEAASGSPSPSVSNPAAVRLDGVFPLSHAGRALGAGRQQRRGTASGIGPAPSGVNARGGLRQDGGIRSSRGHRVLRCAHRPAAPPP